MKKNILHWIFCLGCLYAMPVHTWAQINMSQNSTSQASLYMPHQLIVKFRSATTIKGYSIDDASFPTRYTAFKQLGVRNNQKLHPHFKSLKQNSNSYKGRNKRKLIDLSQVYKIDIDPTVDLTNAIQLLRSQPDIEYVEPVYIHHPLVVYQPNDPQAQPGGQYYLSNIKAYEAWAIEKGNPSVTIGMVDFGFIPIHEDLAGNIQYNMADPVDGIDNDQDGYIDNYAGWNVGANNNDLYPATENGVHGTWTSGIAAAVADNGKGIAGTGFKCKFLPVKGEGMHSNGGNYFNGYEGLIYAAEQGCKVINLSWGRRGMPSAYEQEIINLLVKYYDVVIVAAAGNDNNEGLYYPASYDRVISVAGTNAEDKRWASEDPTIGSNFNEKVDICAPSEYITTTSYVNPTETNPNYGYIYVGRSGTSMAAPQVSAAAALIRSKYPALTAQEVTNRLLATADNIDALNPGCAGKLGRGRLNMYKALADAASIQAIALQQFKIANPQGQPFVQSGEKASVSLYFKSMFGTFTNLQVRLSSLTPGVTVTKADASFSSFSQHQSVNNLNNPFEILADAGLGINTEVTFRIDFSDGTFTHTQYYSVIVNPDYLTIQNNYVSLTISSQGRFGYDDDFVGWFEKGAGFSYKGKHLLFESGLMLGTNAVQVSNNIMSEIVGDFYYGNTYIYQAIGKDDHFTSSQNLKTFHTPAKDVEVRGMFTDTDKNKNADPIGVAVTHRNYTWKDDKFIIVEYQITNISEAEIPALYTGLSANFDIQGSAKNKAAWDAAYNLGYTYNIDSLNLYAGIQLLTGQQPHYYVIDHASGIDLLDDFQFTTAEKFTSLSSGLTKTQSVNNALDVQQTLSAQINNLKPGETRIVAFAFLAGDNLADIQASAVIARNKFNQLKTSPAPLVASVEVCKDGVASILPQNGQNFNLYNSLPLTAPVAKGRSFNLGKVTRDSTYYITSTDSLYESQPVAIEVKAITHTTAFNIAQDTIGLYEGEVLRVTDKSKEAINWKWFFGDNSTSSAQNPTHSYLSPGKYRVKLITENRLGCRDSLIREVLVVNGKKSLTPVIADKVLCNSEKLVLSPVNGTKFNLYKQLPITTPLAQGSSFDLGSFEKDTIFYITCTDFLLESEPVAVHIKVSLHSSRFETSSDTLDLRLQQQLQITDKSAGAVQWEWNFGDGQTSNEQHPMHVYDLPGEYTLTLKSKNIDGCESTYSLKIVVIQTTGLDEDINKLVSIFPNPSSGKVTISFAEGFTNSACDIKIINILGKEIYKSTVQGVHVVDLSACTKGQYIVRLTIAGRVLHKKLLIF